MSGLVRAAGEAAQRRDQLGVQGAERAAEQPAGAGPRHPGRHPGRHRHPPPRPPRRLRAGQGGGPRRGAAQQLQSQYRGPRHPRLRGRRAPGEVRHHQRGGGPRHGGPGAVAQGQTSRRHIQLLPRLHPGLGATSQLSGGKYNKRFGLNFHPYNCSFWCRQAPGRPSPCSCSCTRPRS